MLRPLMLAWLGTSFTFLMTALGAATVFFFVCVVCLLIGVKAQKENFGFGVEAGGAFGSDYTQSLFGQVRVDYRF